MKTVFLRALETDDKAEALRAAIREPKTASGSQRFEVDAASFTAVPRSPFAYWVSDRVRRLFVEMPPFENNQRLARAGLQTSDDFRFVRAWWEVASVGLNSFWWPFAKGGTFSPFYGNINLVVNWCNDGHETKSYAETTPGSNHWSRNLRSAEHYFRPGLTWLRRSHRFSASALPSMSLFSDGAQAILSEVSELGSICAAVNSSAFDALVKLAVGRTGSGVQFMPGMVAASPLSQEIATDQALASLFRRAWLAKRRLDARSETSRAFTVPAILRVVGETLGARVAAYTKQAGQLEAELAEIQAEIDARCFELYSFDEADRRAIREGYGGEEVEPADADEDSDEDDENNANMARDTTSLVAELMSWAVGVTFGRFDMRLADIEGAVPAEPEPFDPLPICSPAMLTGSNGLPLASPPDDYALAFPMNGLLVDDPGHPRDLLTAMRVVFNEVFGMSADAWWNEAAAMLDPDDHSVRAWLASSFFEHHLKRHSKGRRKAPIFWQLGVPSGRYSIWASAHRLTRDSFFQIQNEVVIPKLAHEERQLTGLVERVGTSPSAKERKEVATQEAFVDELRTFLDEIKRVAPLWNPTLDDGVMLTMAPLWRLLRQHKSWQSELKGTWDDLAAGKFNWAHLAMHLWPERVVPNCAIDRSLAIAHGLEDAFWTEGDDGKWKARSAPTRPIDDLVHERTSVAVKAALQGLTEAPVPTGSKARTRRSPL